MEERMQRLERKNSTEPMQDKVVGNTVTVVTSFPKERLARVGVSIPETSPRTTRIEE